MLTSIPRGSNKAIRNNKPVALMNTLLFIALTASVAAGEEGWWMREPVRWVQTNLRETDAALDPKRLIEQMVDYRANVLHFSMGGIVAFYPTKVPFHYASAYLPAGKDLMGEIVQLAHANGIRVVGRFDLSKTRKEVFDAHPEWFFRKANGEPVIYNGLYSTCINGGYYRDHAIKILSEALERYDVDGLFFNMFGNQSRDYSGTFVGHCHCDSCKRRYRELYSKELPQEPDEQYLQFMFRCSREVAAEIGTLIHAKRPKAGYFNYIHEWTDGIMSESNTAVNRPLPLWPYASSDNVNRGRNSEPEKMAVNLNMQFVDFPWRFATVPRHEIALRAWQNLAHGGALTLAVNGTFDHEDRQAIEAARSIFRWAAENEEYFVKQESGARVLLLGGPARTGRTYSQAAYRGLFRFLSEEHIPFAVSDNVNWIGKREFDLVIASDWVPPELQTYIAKGGRLIIASSRQPEIPSPRVVATHKDVESYFRVRNREMFPSLRLTNLIMLDGDFAEVEGDGSASLSFVPPSMFGPPEKIHVDMKDTMKPGLVSFANGHVTWIPWDVAGLYYRHSLPAHAGVLRDVVDRMLPNRQIRTDAHPLVEISLMRQGGRMLLHLVNVSGHSDTAYFAPLPIRNIRVEVAGKYTHVRAVRAGSSLKVAPAQGATAFTIPELADYELLVLE
jgi:hypothetical protein